MGHEIKYNWICGIYDSSLRPGRLNIPNIRYSWTKEASGCTEHLKQNPSSNEIYLHWRLAYDTSTEVSLVHLNLKGFSYFTWGAPSRVTSIQSRVLPLLTDPPSLVKNVCSLMLNVERVTLIVRSKTNSTPVSLLFSLRGILPINLDVYKFVVQGLLQLNEV